MDQPLTVAPGVRRLTVNLDSDDVDRFEGTWPVPGGIALHAYLVQGERAVIVDPWDAGGYGPEELEADLAQLGLGWKDIAAVAFTKAPRPDLLPRLRTENPRIESWGLPETDQVHDLGGLALESRNGFWVLPSASLAFTGDVFAGLGWVEDELWTEDLDEAASRYFEDEALRWFCARPLVPGGLPAGTKMAAPAHGCLWRQAANALDRAQRFETWAQGAARDEITVVWPADPAQDGLVEALVGGALDAGADLNLFRIPGDDTTVLAAGARRAALIVVGPGLDEGFLAGLRKTVWNPPSTASADSLRKGLAERYRDLPDPEV